MTTTTARTAAELCRDYLAALERQDVPALIDLLAPDAITEFPFAPEGIQRLYTGAEVQPFIELVIARLLASVKITDLEITEVSASLIFAELRSDCVTKKGLAYQNRYIVKVTAADGKITLWREYFDPRATETVK